MSWDIEDRYMARSPSRVTEPDGPTFEQLERVELLRDSGDYDSVQISDWFQGSGALYVSAHQAGRLRARFRIDEDGRAVPERIWS